MPIGLAKQSNVDHNKNSIESYIRSRTLENAYSD